MSLLRRQASTAVKWSGASQLGRQVLQVVTLIVLARLVSPSDFGLLAMAAVFVGFANIFRDLGTASAVVRHHDPSQTLLSTVFWSNIGLGLTIATVLALLAPLVARLYDEPRVTSVVRVLALSFVAASFGLVPQALLERRLMMARLAAIELSAAAVGGAVAVACALANLGVWSLVAQTLVTATSTSAALSFACGWRPTLGFSMSDIRSIAGFGLNLSGFNTVNYFSRNADNFLIGRYLGEASLGFYSLAYRMLLFPIQNISAVIARVMYPVYSRVRDDDERFRRAYLAASSAIALVSFPLMLGLMVLAGPFVLAVFGPTWSQSIPLVTILAPIGLLQSLGTLVGSIYMAKGRTDILFKWGTAASVAVVLSFLIGLRWGVVGVAAAYAIAMVSLTYPSLAIPFSLIGLRVSALARSVSRVALASLLMVAAIVLVRVTVVRGLPPWVVLATCVPVGMGAYLGCMWVIQRSLLLDVFAALTGKSAVETTLAPKASLGEHVV